jgi:hypothetical protein
VNPFGRRTVCDPFSADRRGTLKVVQQIRGKDLTFAISVQDPA